MRTLAVVLVLAGVATAEPTKLTPSRNWVAVIRDEKLKAKAPKNNLITDAKTFEALWKAWRKDEKVPEVDFKKEFGVITFASGPNRPGVSATVDEGNLKIMSFQTLIGGPGFGYSIATFPRKGIKTVMGVKLP
jgi:hypothetical protein